MSRFMAGWIAASAVILAATAVQAQTLYPDDTMIIRRGPYGAVPPGPVRGGYLDDEAYDDAVPSREVVKMVRSLGFKPLGPAVRRRGVYTVSAVNRQGEEGRVVVDAYSGRMMRFVATTVGSAEPGGAPVAAQPQPPKESPKADAAASRPPLPAPGVASRTPPNQSPTAPAPAQPADAATATAAATPETRGVGAAPPAQQSAVAQAKPAVAAAGPAATKPAVQLQPTQEMPPVQGLD